MEDINTIHNKNIYKKQYIFKTDKNSYKKFINILNNDSNLNIEYFLSPIQYDGRIKRILKYFYLNNEPLFYLALSYCSKKII